MGIINRLIIFLIRLKLHLKKGQCFQFTNQKTDSVYWFTELNLMKMEHGYRNVENFWDNPKFLIGTDQSSGGLVRTSGKIDIDVEELVRTIAGVLQLPERVLTGAFTSAENEKQWQRFLEINGMR